MFRHGKSAIVVFCVLAVALAAGCGRENEADPAASASINGGQSLSALAADASMDPLYPEVVIETSKGNITVELNMEKAKLTVENFLQYVRSGHYDQTIVHRVIKDRVILAGGFGKNFIEKSGRDPIYNDAVNGLKNTRGTIAMARLPDGIHSATCQFFINLADNTSLDFRDTTPEGYGYCVFGKVTEGMDVVDRIANVEVHDIRDFESVPVQQVVVASIREKGSQAKTKP